MQRLQHRSCQLLSTHTSSNNPIEPLLEPRDRIVLLDFVLETDSAMLVFTFGHSHTRSTHANVAVKEE